MTTRDWKIDLEHRIDDVKLGKKQRVQWVDDFARVCKLLASGSAGDSDYCVFWGRFHNVLTEIAHSRMKVLKELLEGPRADKEPDWILSVGAVYVQCRMLAKQFTRSQLMYADMMRQTESHVSQSIARLFRADEETYNVKSLSIFFDDGKVTRSEFQKHVRSILQPVDGDASKIAEDFATRCLPHLERIREAIWEEVEWTPTEVYDKHEYLARIKGKTKKGDSHRHDS